MGKRLVLRRGGLAVIDAEAGDDWGDANSIGDVTARILGVEIVNCLRGIEAICGQADYKTIRNKHADGGAEVAIEVNLTAECDAYRGRGDRYIVLLEDVGPDQAGTVMLTPAPAAEVQIHHNIARYAEAWEIVACAVDVPLPAFGDRLGVAHRLHGGRAWN